MAASRGPSSHMSTLKFTGERFVPTERGRIAYEHYHRYAASLEMARNKVVLDIASGEGFGAQLLSRTAKEGMAIDIDEPAIRHAQETYGHLPTPSFWPGHCRSIPLPPGSIDLVVCF